MLRAQDLAVTSLGACRVQSPLVGRREHFVGEGAHVLVGNTLEALEPYLASGEPPPAFEAAGPRRELFFSPDGLRCGVVTCGGLCPGLNDVIRSLVLTLHYSYGVSEVDGFRYGFEGLSKMGLPPLVLTSERVDDIHKQGGTLLGSSRGPQDVGQMVDTLEARNISILFAVGGDGTLRGASALSREIARRGLKVGVVGVPKTIDNDLFWIERSFGFATAVEAARAIAAAHAEARGAYNGIGLVKLMGRHSGFITAHAALVDSDCNFCLVPEVPFELTGDGAFLPALEARLSERHHAVVAVAEGAAQGLLGSEERGLDPSGNVRLGDVGLFLRAQIERYFEERETEVTVKYIDPSYLIRGVSANALDSQYCLALAQHAVHAGMSGSTDVMIGYWNQHFTQVPLPLVTSQRKQLTPGSDVWQQVLSATGQPNWRPVGASEGDTVSKHGA